MGMELAMKDLQIINRGIVICREYIYIMLSVWLPAKGKKKKICVASALRERQRTLLLYCRQFQHIIS